MSGAGLPVETVTSTADRIPNPGIIKPQRSIGGLLADVTIEESGNDELAITQHPVQKSADITDHAYKLPVTLTCRIGFSPAGPGTAGGNDQGSQGDPVPLQTIYENYRTLQSERQLIEVQTGKRLYQNMLVKTIALVTDKDTENALFLTIGLQEIILVDTQTVAGVPVPPTNVQAKPQKTANTVNAGTKQPTPKPPTFNSDAYKKQYLADVNQALF